MFVSVRASHFQLALATLASQQLWVKLLSPGLVYGAMSLTNTSLLLVKVLSFLVIRQPYGEVNLSKVSK